MEQKFETILVRQCAPTLIGIKPANLFRYQSADKCQFRESTSCWSRRLAPYGIAIRILKCCPAANSCLVYLYRPRCLRSFLMEPANREFLRQRGYQTEQSCQGLLRQLTRRLCQDQEFPHEIGLFLGYPLEDVVGFIENSGRNYTCCGYWKSYSDPETALRCFEQYRHCTAICMERFLRGESITQLIVA